MTGHAVLTPMLMVIVMITGDFLSMSLTTDRVRPSKMPNSWQIGRITIAGVILGVCFLAFSTAILAIGQFEMHLGIESLRTLCAVGIAPQPDPRTIFRSGYSHHHNDGDSRNRHGSLGHLGRRLRVCRGDCIWVGAGRSEDSRLCSSPHLLNIQALSLLTDILPAPITAPD